MWVGTARTVRWQYAVVVAGVSISLLLLSGLIGAHSAYVEARDQIALRQWSQARAAAREIDRELMGLERGLNDVAKMPWGQPGWGLEERRQEFQRLMALQPALKEIQWIDASLREQLFVSRTQPDRFGSGTRVAVDAELIEARHSRFGRPGFGEDDEPRVIWVQPDAAGARLLAQVQLRFLTDVLSQASVEGQTSVYLLDADNRVVGHTRAVEALRALDRGQHPAVQAARRRLGDGPDILSPIAIGGAGIDAIGIDGKPAIATAVAVPRLDGVLVVEQARALALEPAFATLLRTLGLATLAVGIALAVSVVMARRLAAPILTLSGAAARFARGEFNTRINIAAGNELDTLALDFNRMAERLQGLYIGLEEQVLTRTADLNAARGVLQQQATDLGVLNQRLVDQLQELGQRKDEAERANAAKTRFLASASHDLRQPMHTIGLLASVLQMRLAASAPRELADKLQQSVQSMEALFSSLLDISQLDAGAVQARVETVDLALLMQRVGDRFQPQAAAAGLAWRLRSSPALVHSDPVVLERMIGNLVANAIVHTPRGSVLLAIRRRSATVAIQVYDTGVGIAEAHQTAVFEEFVRLQPAGQAGSRGLGLGLAIVRRSADLLGHRLTLRSRPGQGSMFEIEMPRVSAPAIPLPVAVDFDHAAVQGAFVVIVDDEDGNRESLAALCRDWGCHVVAAASIPQVLQLLSGHLRAPDLVITDYRLASDADGFGLLQSLRDGTGEDMPAIVLTADVSADLHQRASDAGAVLMHKPVGVQRLLACIAGLMHRQSDR